MVDPLTQRAVFCLARTHLVDSLQAFIDTGGRKIGAWTAQHRLQAVPFNTAADDPYAFANANTQDELQRLEKT